MADIITCLPCPDTQAQDTVQTVVWGIPVGDVVLKPVRAGRPGRLCDAVLAARKAAAVRVVIAWTLEAAVYVIRPHSCCADEVYVDDPGEGRITQGYSLVVRLLLHSRSRDRHCGALQEMLACKGIEQ